MKKRNARHLLKKYLAGNCTDEEKARIESWYIQQRHDEVPLLSQEERLEDMQAIRRSLSEGLGRQRRTHPYRYAAAAAILIAASLSYYFLIVNQPTATVGHGATAFAPGTNRATLTLADGSIIDLDSTQTAIVVSDEAIGYQDGAPLASVVQGNTSFVELKTPRGGNYQVVLSDGTRVWLNSASTLKYPLRFGDSRHVELHGEAYFEVKQQTVTKNGSVAKAPFIVKSADQEITVLGTSFNVNAYGDEERVRTTLVTGAVKVSTPNGSLALEPGEETVLEKTSGRLAKQLGDLPAATAWINGYFDLNHKPFDAILRELARWYDLEISYEGPVPDIRFFGEADRYSDFSIVLAMLESNHVAYRITGRKLEILGKQ